MKVSEKTSARPEATTATPAAAPSADGEASEGWGWTPVQRVGLGLLVFLLIGFLAIQYWRRPAMLGEGSVTVEGGVATLPLRVDPNVASIEELSRIPHLGEKTASKIIAYRDSHRDADGVAFHREEDLGRVGGIGKALLEQVRAYLVFPTDAEIVQDAPAPLP
jgi:competence ComEA-like helix-hairpin-helix protein